MAINNKVKTLIKNLPGIRKLVQKNFLLEQQLKEARYNAVQVGRQAVDYRLKLKAINNEKINVIFVCHRPAVWESLHSVYDAMKNNNSFNVYIVAIPNKKELPKLWLNHEVYESEGAEDFWKDYDCINGYNYKTKEWFDLKQLKPDYVFFQQPYNITRCEEYKSWNVAQYAKICYLNYFSPENFGELYDESIPQDFMRDISFYFTQNKKDHEFIINRYNRIGFQDTECIMTGYPRYDRLSEITGNSDIWFDKEHKTFRVVWTPRWTTNEGTCHFFKYKDKLIDFCTENNIELVLRPHPQAFKEWAATGELTLEEQEELRETFKNNNILHLDETPNYYDMFYSSDCLISDPSSIVYDYFLSGKPIILCKGNSNNIYFELLDGGLYETDTWDELNRVLLDLISRKDYLAAKRKELMKSAYYINPTGAGKEIASILKN